MKKLIVLLILLAAVVGVYGCTQCLPIVQNQEQFQAQVQSQSQSQSVSQQNTQQVIVKDGKTLDVGTVMMYSRLVYPGEVLTYEVGEGDGCSVIAAYPVGLYTITPVNGYGVDMVQTKESLPTYDPIRHKMEFGHVPVIDKIDYWTEKAFLKSTTDGYCVVDNRAPGNQYVTIELRVFKATGL